EHQQFHSRLSDSLKKTALGVGLLAVLIFIFRETVVRIIFGTGAFRGASVVATASVLGILMFSVVAQSLVPIMSRAFYALQNTKTPVLVSILSIAVNIGLGLWFTSSLHWGVKGLATSFAIAGNLNFFLLYILFRRQYL
ncbi:MAG: polysaccharide biosynthesis C-terminal domain-containing protein, partial [Candidatus Yanofskybacteria bacterium]|nr:polysaccharide biosynthesis C-terminal domain-containing protein [Candidatus Yanofskybacteria bacterium]